MARRLPFLLLALALAPAAMGQNAPRKRVTLALAGGGAYGLMYLGALEWMERHRIPVDTIVGTSGGALVGGWYATGIEMLSDEEILRPVEPRGKDELRLKDAAPYLAQIDYDRLFASGADYRNLTMPQKREARRFPNDLFAGIEGGNALRRKGLVEGQTVGFLLDWIGRDYGRGFDALPTPFRAVATDATDPKRLRTVVFGGPDSAAPLGLAEAIRASIAVPLLFTPVEVKGRTYDDGAVRDNFPSDQAIDAFHPEILIGLCWDNGYGPDPYRPGRGGEEPGEKRIVTLDPRPFRVDQFGKWRELAWRGYQGMEARAAELERYALSPEAYLAYRRGRRAHPFDHTVRRVTGDLGDLGDVRRAVLGKNLDDVAATQRLGTALDRLVSDRGLATAGYDLRPDGTLFVRTTLPGGGPPILRVGLDAQTNSGDRPYADLVAQLSSLRPDRPLYYLDGSLGTDPALAGGLELPLGHALSVGPTFRLDRQPEFRFAGDGRRSGAAISTAEAGLGLFYRPSRSTEFSLGGFAGANGASNRSGDSFDAGTGSYRGLFARAELDETDDPVVPRRGGRAFLEGRGYGGMFGQLSGGGEVYVGPPHDAFGLRLAFGSSLGSDAPFPFEFRPTVEPYRRDEVRGDAFLSLGLSETHALGPLPFALGRVFLVSRLENAWADGRAYPGGSVSLLTATRLGAASLGLGVADHGVVRVFLGIGRRF